MMTVLLTGANGLLGQKIVNLLANRPAIHLIATSKGENRNPMIDGYTYQSMDIANFNSLSAVFEEFKPDVVINSAAMTNVDACELNPEECNAINIQAVKYLCGLCKERNAKLIHISTDFIFDGTAGPYKETDLPNPLSVYGNSKWEAEKVIQKSEITYAIIRTVLIYGTVPGLGRSNIVLWVRDSLMNGKKINVVTDQWRTPTLSEDLADGIALVLLKEKTGIFHISGAEMFSIYDLACRVADYFKLDKNLITPVDGSMFSQPAKRPPKTGFIILKAQTELGYKPHDLNSGLEIVARQLAVE